MATKAMVTLAAILFGSTLVNQGLVIVHTLAFCGGLVPEV
jgi:hypothetical protein